MIRTRRPAGRGRSLIGVVGKRYVSIANAAPACAFARPHCALRRFAGFRAVELRFWCCAKRNRAAAQSKAAPVKAGQLHKGEIKRNDRAFSPRRESLPLDHPRGADPHIGRPRRVRPVLSRNCARNSDASVSRIGPCRQPLYGRVYAELSPLVSTDIRHRNCRRSGTFSVIGASEAMVIRPLLQGGFMRCWLHPHDRFSIMNS